MCFSLQLSMCWSTRSSSAWCVWLPPASSAWASCSCCSLRSGIRSPCASSAPWPTRRRRSTARSSQTPASTHAAGAEPTEPYPSPWHDLWPVNEHPAINTDPPCVSLCMWQFDCICVLERQKKISKVKRKDVFFFINNHNINQSEHRKSQKDKNMLSCSLIELTAEQTRAEGGVWGLKLPFFKIIQKCPSQTNSKDIAVN